MLNEETRSVKNPSLASNTQSRITLGIGSDLGTGVGRGSAFFARKGMYFGLADYENRPFNLYMGSGASSTSKLSITTNGNAVLSGTMTATQFKLSALNTAPTSSTATGTTGEIRIVDGFIYVAVGTNTWQRATLSTF